ncbi:MAG TPA: SufE family protein, partial [Geminicoccaceae bacterium]|nr:SufE family protein [Geminicoccaceae bacterium]
MTQAPTIAEEQRLIAEDFELFDDWREKIEYVLDLGRNLAPFPEQHRTETNKVKGCQSQVWMVAQMDQGSGRMRIAADSDAFIVRGLIALLLRLYA